MQATLRRCRWCKLGGGQVDGRMIRTPSVPLLVLLLDGHMFEALGSSSDAGI